MQVNNQNFQDRKLEVRQELLQNSIVCVDSHTGGEPTRLVVGGIPVIEGNTIVEKNKYFAQNFDYLRTTLTGEPRAHAAMHAAIFLPPSSDEADFGLLFICALGYLDMCGHALIGSVASAIDAGIIPAEEPETKVTVETPAGIMKVRARISAGKVENVTFRNQPSFVYQRGLEVEVDSLGKLTVDIAYGGNWYAIVDADQVGLEIGLENLAKLSEASQLILKTVNATTSAKHPHREEHEDIPQLLFMGPPTHPKANGKNLVTSVELGFDRSPCGTGSSAKMGLLCAKGKLNLNEDYVHESGIVGTLFKGRLVEATKVGSIDAVVPEITGSAYITGINQIVIDPRDPLKHGFYTS